jgi:hypothetical protein
MDCAAASERLPWLLNGSLDAPEADEVRGHVTGCPRCGQEMDETRRAAAVFDAHLPSSVVLDLAWERPLEADLSELARVHLERCASCRDELDLARASRQLESVWPEASPVRRSPAWRAVVLPATLAAGLVLGLWWGTRGDDAVSDSPETVTRIAALEAELARLRAVVATHDVPAPRIAVPRLNLPVFEILPSLVQRGPGDEANEIQVPAGATEIALLLGTDAPIGARAALTIEDDQGTQVWRGEGLVAGPPGGYVVVMPVELLPDGRYRIAVQPASGRSVAYTVHVRRALPQ